LFQLVLLIVVLFAFKDHSSVREHGAVFIVLTLMFFLALMAPGVYLFFVVPLRSYKLLKHENGEVEVRAQPVPTAPPQHYP
jgi:hypothetical protein